MRDLKVFYLHFLNRFCIKHADDHNYEELLEEAAIGEEEIEEADEQLDLEEWAQLVTYFQTQTVHAAPRIFNNF